MNLYRLVYISRHSESLSSDDIEAILNASREHNQRHGISGILLFCKHYFLQCLEGSREQVNQTYNTIVKDQRHCDALILSYDNIEQRAFGDWAMAYVPETKLTKAQLFKYCAHATFDPYTLSSKSALALLISLQDAAC